MAGGGVGVSPRVAATTIEEWAKVVSEEAEKHLPHIALMKSKGRIKQGQASGGGMRWVIRVKDHSLQGFADMSPIHYERVNTKFSATLPWRGYYMVDSISLREKLEQGGPEAMIKVFANREEVMRRAGIRSLADKFYLDGNTPANVANEEFHGIESFMGIGTQVASDLVASVHDDTYGGLSTAVAGLDPVNTRAFTPVIINTAHTPVAGLRTWAATADQYLRAAILRSTYGAGPGDRVGLFTLTQAAFEDLLNLLDDKERIMVMRGDSTKLVSMGFSAVEVDGVPVIWDAAVPVTDSDATVVSGYGWTIDQMELRLMNSGNLFSSKVTYNSTFCTDDILLYIVGNLKFNPRHFVKLASITGVV
jgi:hypothetical protein